MPDIEILRLIWWMLLGILFIGFAITDGFDLGIAAMLPFVARNDLERRVVLNTIGPVWEGNQVWIILGAGAIFAAWPLVYAVTFSCFYFLILLLLLTMGISRPVSFKYRSKLKNPLWRSTWDTSVFVGGVVPALILGILVGNILQGIPYQLDDYLRVSYQGNFLSLFNPFACFCGVVSLLMLLMHGGIYLAIKTEHPLSQRAMVISRASALLLVAAFILGGFWVAFYLNAYQLSSVISPQGYSTPLHKEVERSLGAWIHNYYRYPWSLGAPMIGIVGALLAWVAIRYQGLKSAFLLSSLSIFGIITTVGVSMFPFIIPSSLEPASSLLVWDASSTQLSLFLMLIAALVFIPLIVIYTSWVYYVMRGKVTNSQIMQN